MKSRALPITLALLALVLLAFALAPTAAAADFRTGNDIVISADQVIDDDLFVAAQTVTIDGTIKGDLYAAANTVIINGTVERDVFAVGQTVTINGTVGESLRTAGQSIVLGSSAKIGHSILGGAYSFETQPGSTVNGDFVYGGYQALLGGSIARDVVAAVNALEITGTVGRNVRATVGSDRGGAASSYMFPGMSVAMPDVPAGLTIAPTAHIGGSVTYQASAPAAIDPEAQVTGPVAQQTPVPGTRSAPAVPTAAEIQNQQQQAFQNQLFDYGRRFIILLALGLLALWLLPKWIKGLADAIQSRPLGTLGRGILMIAVFIIALLALVVIAAALALIFGILTLGDLAGLSVGIATTLGAVLIVGWLIFTSYIAPIVVSYLGGRLILERIRPQWAAQRVIPFILGLIIFSLLVAIPILGWLIGLLVTILALGALWLWGAPFLARNRPIPAQQV